MSDLVEQQSAVVPLASKPQQKTEQKTELQSLAEQAVKSGMFPDLTAAQAALKMQLADDLNINRSLGLGGIHVVKGKMVLSSNLIAALVKRSSKYRYRVVEHTDKVCKIAFHERLDDGKWEMAGESTFTVEMAKRAQLIANPTWTKYPESMLYSRAIVQGVRWYCPDLIMAPVYSEEEAESFLGGNERVTRSNVNARPVSGNEMRNYESPRELVRSVQEAN